MNHILWAYPLVEFFSSHVAEAKSFFLERRAVAVCSVCDLSSLVVADVRIERSDEHQGVIQELLDTWVVRLDTGDAVDIEGDSCVA